MGGEYTFFMTTWVVALTFLYFLSTFLSFFSRQLHLAKGSSVKARRREWTAEAAEAAKWRACVLPWRMQLCDASVGVKLRREVQPEVCGAARQTREVENIKENKNNDAALWVLVPPFCFAGNMTRLTQVNWLQRFSEINKKELSSIYFQYPFRPALRVTGSQRSLSQLNLERTQADTRRACKLHTERPPGPHLNPQPFCHKVASVLFTAQRVARKSTTS